MQKKHSETKQKHIWHNKSEVKHDKVSSAQSGTHFSASHKIALGHEPKKHFFSNIKSFFSKRVLSIILVLFLLFSILLLFFVFSLSEELSTLKLKHDVFVFESNSKISSLNENIFVLEKEKNGLNLNLANLQDLYNSLSNSNAQLNKSYSELKSEANTTIAKIEDYEIEIKKSLDWFGANSVLDNSRERILLNLKSSCLEKSSSRCEINLGCFFLVNSEFLNYEYKFDSATSGVVDKLQSVNDFVKNGGGDCEDYSLFFKAELNSLAEECLSSEVSLFGWVEKNNNTFWANTSKSWYLPNADKKYFDKNNLFPIVVCGSMFDPKSNEINGHCVIALTKSRIVSFSDISSLNFAELVEPQTGEYLGVVGGFSGIYLASENLVSSSYIDTLITDADFFLYRGGKWNNYSEFGVELAQRKSALMGLLGE